MATLPAAPDADRAMAVQAMVAPATEGQETDDQAMATASAAAATVRDPGASHTSARILCFAMPTSGRGAATDRVESVNLRTRNAPPHARGFKNWISCARRDARQKLAASPAEAAPRLWAVVRLAVEQAPERTVKARASARWQVMAVADGRPLAYGRAAAL
jgi:hypothetical protein